MCICPHFGPCHRGRKHTDFLTLLLKWGTLWRSTMVQVHSQCETLHVSFPDVAQSTNYTTPSLPSYQHIHHRGREALKTQPQTLKQLRIQSCLWTPWSSKRKFTIFFVSMIVFGVILSIRTGFCFVLQTEVLSAGQHTSHGHDGVGGRLEVVWLVLALTIALFTVSWAPDASFSKMSAYSWELCISNSACNFVLFVC